ncbi:cytochrome c oxidase subunit II [Sinorhizobium psoraleae]|uniref:Cytochrome aa3 subunit 2 n=1 Tax=Sinorhizobium psoraleae TaxID=520838 RepID=A0ABT4KK12_9HYPH|nr:cytochrome c oxidase subunit II [Sinorhizobium psoraleae]MCZ4091302.1 cytochrome c oxidase subunit II [Sinorhizobium psoraleae]
MVYGCHPEQRRSTFGRYATGAPFLCCGCTGRQSALDTAGSEADATSFLFWVLVSTGAFIWLAVVGLLVYALRNRRRMWSEDAAGKLILWAGPIFSSVVLFALLTYALWLMPGLRPSSAGALRIEVTGTQFWWRVAYHQSPGPPAISANEIRLPVGEPVELVLRSDDVVHSFWIPSLGGKMDMIPGRTNRLSLLANKAGIYGGVCTEFCGTSHALMAFSAVAMRPDDFDRWLAAQSNPAANAGGSGKDLFMRHGCGSCHRIDGTEARGLVGPDLSHLGGRETVGAGILPNSEDAIARFIAEPGVLKPGTRMPSFAMLPPDEIRAIATYLKGLK